MRIITTAAAGMAALLLAACSTGVTPTTDTDPTGTATTSEGGGAASIYLDEIPRPESCDADSPFIAVALPNLTNPYYVYMKKGFEDAGTEAGFEVEVQVADNDDAAQLAQRMIRCGRSNSAPTRHPDLSLTIAHAHSIGQHHRSRWPI